MTPEEYAKKVAARLNDDISNYEFILNNAQNVLQSSKLSQINVDLFWISLSKEFTSVQEINENISSSIVNKQIMAAKQAIANRIFALKKS